MRYCVLLPAYNEEKAITELIKQIKDLGLEVVVIDDGSLDNTAAVALKLQVVVLLHKKNRGKGQALRTGFNYAIKNEYDGIIIMDADGQHLASEIPGFIESANKSDAGIIIGNRMEHPKGMPCVRRMTNSITSLIISILMKCKVPDSQCGFRLIKTGVLKKLNLSTMHYDTETEILLEASRDGFRVESILIQTVYSNQKSRINPILDTVRFCFLIFKNLIRKNRRCKQKEIINNE